MKSAISIIAVLAVLAGCASKPNPSLVRKQLESIDLSAFPSAPLLVEIPSLGGVALLTEVGRNGDIVTFASADGKSVSTKAGILVRTAGFGPDLYFSDPSSTLAALRNSPGQPYKRTYQFLNEQERMEDEIVQCEMHSKGKQTTPVFGVPRDLWYSVETCRGKDVSIRNEYWHNATGYVTKSKERVSFGLGYVIIDHVPR